jgi:hypothetical protein
MYRRTVRGDTVNAELELQFGGNPLFAPRRIRASDGRNQLLHIDRQSRAPQRARPPSPEEAVALTMPSDERFRFDDGERRFPINEPGEQDEGDSCRVTGSVGPDSTLRVEGKLLPQKEVLGRQPRA